MALLPRETNAFVPLWTQVSTANRTSVSDSLLLIIIGNLLYFLRQFQGHLPSFVLCCAVHHNKMLPTLSNNKFLFMRLLPSGLASLEDLKALPVL